MTDHFCAASRDGSTCMQPAVALVHARQLVGVHRVNRTMYVCAEHQRLGIAPAVTVTDLDGIVGIVVDVDVQTNGDRTVVDVTVATDVDGFGAYVTHYGIDDLQVTSPADLAREIADDPDLLAHWQRIVAYATDELAARLS